MVLAGTTVFAVSPAGAAEAPEPTAVILEEEPDLGARAHATIQAATESIRAQVAAAIQLEADGRLELLDEQLAVRVDRAMATADAERAEAHAVMSSRTSEAAASAEARADAAQSGEPLGAEERAVIRSDRADDRADEQGNRVDDREDRRNDRVDGRNSDRADRRD